MIEIEKEIPSSQYNSDDHRRAVCQNILENWITISRSYKYHAILATSSIQEACEYYRILKEMMSDEDKGYPSLNITALFDPNTDNVDVDWDIFKESAIAEMLEDYNTIYGTTFDISSYQKFKKDVANRLAHKKPYRLVKHEDGNTLDLLIVVKQMLTGFDSMWINALHLDRRLEYEDIVQSFSRTNRLNDNDKNAGLIYYYRYPNTMEVNVYKAFSLYSGDKPYGIFVDKLEGNIAKINSGFDEIKRIFESNGIDDFSRLPVNSPADIAQFVLKFNELCDTIESAKVQGFRWEKNTYTFAHDDGTETEVSLHLDEKDFNTLLARYKELLPSEMPTGTTLVVPPYDIDATLIVTDADKINLEYMESNFTKYISEIQIDGPDGETARKLLDILRRSFSSLSQEDQKLANIIINKIQFGDLKVEEGETFHDILASFRDDKRNSAITAFCKKWCLPEDRFRVFESQYISLSRIDESGNLEKLKSACDRESLVKKLSQEKGKPVKPIEATIALDIAIRNFMASNCMESD